MAVHLVELRSPRLLGSVTRTRAAPYIPSVRDVGLQHSCGGIATLSPVLMVFRHVGQFACFASLIGQKRGHEDCTQQVPQSSAEQQQSRMNDGSCPHLKTPWEVWNSLIVTVSSSCSCSWWTTCIQNVQNVVSMQRPAANPFLFSTHSASYPPWQVV